MAEVVHEFEAQAARLRSSAAAAAVQANGSTYPVAGLAFDAAAEEAAFYPLRATRYGSGNWVIDLDWYADTASTNAVVWGAQIAAITPSVDTQDAETDGMGTIATTTTTHLGTTGQRLHRTSVTVTSLDSVAVNDNVTVRVARVAADAADTMAGDAILTYVTVRYSDT